MGYFLLYSGGHFKNTYELLNKSALKFSPVNKIHLFHCMGKIFCTEFQRHSLKVHTKYPGPWFDIKMSSYQYRKSHCGDYKDPQHLDVLDRYLRRMGEKTMEPRLESFFPPFVAGIDLTQSRCRGSFVSFTNKHIFPSLLGPMLPIPPACYVVSPLSSK